MDNLHKCSSQSEDLGARYFGAMQSALVGMLFALAIFGVLVSLVMGLIGLFRGYVLGDVEAAPLIVVGIVAFPLFLLLVFLSWLMFKVSIEEVK